MFRNVLFAAYTVLVAGWSTAVFAAMLLVARVATAKVPDAHDSDTILKECREIIFLEVQADLKAALQKAPAMSISFDDPRLKLSLPKKTLLGPESFFPLSSIGPILKGIIRRSRF